MEYYTFSVYLFSLAVLTILLISQAPKKESDPYPWEGRFFRWIIRMNMILLVVDYLQITLDGTPGVGMFWFLETLAVIQYLAAPVMTGLWVNYVLYYILKDSQRLKVLNRWLFITAIPYAIIVFLNLFGNFIFFYDSTNTYQRGDWFFLFLIIVFAHLFLSVIVILTNRKKIRRALWIPLLVFPLPSVLGGTIQAAFFGLALVWPMTSLAVLMIYVFVQNEKVSTDYLTGLSNRRGFDDYLRLMTRSPFRNTRMAGMILDLDRFKQINDQHGHIIGDEVLKATAEILRSSSSPNDIVARVGGDEFGILLQCEFPDELENAVSRIQTAFQSFNEKRIFPFDISVSIGADIFLPSQENSVRGFTKRLDELMYQDKSR